MHCLLSFFSTGFPLEKAEAYVELRKPFCVNNLSSEHLLRDRRLFYGVMRRHHIPVPHHVVLNRDGFEGKPNSVVQEFEDYVVVDGTRVNKPFVEKPVDAEVRRASGSVHGIALCAQQCA